MARTEAQPLRSSQLDPCLEPAPAVSVVLPIFQEAISLPFVIEGVVEILKYEGFSFEIVAVDDGSKDSSLEVLLELQKRYPECLRIAQHVTNKGNGAALRTGIRLSKGEIVVCMDADGQHCPEEILKLVRQIPPYDMVVGIRTASYQGSWYRNLANRFYNIFASWLTGTKIQDLTSGFRAMRRCIAVHFLPLYPQGFSSPTTVTMAFLKAGYNILYVPIEVRKRAAGRSKINLIKDGSRFITIILRMIMLYDPLRIFIPITSFLGILGFISMGLGIFVAKRLVVPGSSVVLFIAAIVTLMLGLVATQVSNASIQYYGDEYIHLYESSIGPTS